MVKGVFIGSQGPNTESKQAVSADVNFSTTSNVAGSTHVKLTPVV
jgi:hypothetical protein